MQTELFSLKNYSNWGELIKKWASEPGSRPKNPKEFKDQLIAYNVEATFDADQFTAVEFTEISPTVLSIRLPPAKMIADAVNELKKTKNYVLPPFYEDAFKAELTISDEAGMLRFHAARIGEYTIRFCG